jgi:hypothetical protein
LRHRSRTAYFAQQENLNLELAPIIGHSQHIANPDIPRWLGRLPVGLNPSQVAGPSRQGSCFEEPGSPKPFVDSYRGHCSISFHIGIQVSSNKIAPERIQLLEALTVECLHLRNCPGGYFSD